MKKTVSTLLATALLIGSAPAVFAQGGSNLGGGEEQLTLAERAQIEKAERKKKGENGSGLFGFNRSKKKKK